MFEVNEIVKGHKAGVFVILGFRSIGGNPFAQVKPVHPVTHEAGRGEFALPLTALLPLDVARPLDMGTTLVAFYPDLCLVQEVGGSDRRQGFLSPDEAVEAMTTAGYRFLAQGDGQVWTQ